MHERAFLLKKNGFAGGFFCCWGSLSRKTAEFFRVDVQFVLMIFTSQKVVKRQFIVRLLYRHGLFSCFGIGRVVYHSRFVHNSLHFLQVRSGCDLENRRRPRVSEEAWSHAGRSSEHATTHLSQEKY